MDTIKIIFLDIDGVLVTINSLRENHNGRDFDKTCLEFFNKLVSETKSKIVISSTWRLIHSLEFLKKHFKDQGFLFPENIIGTTTKEYADRGLQVHQWLEDNKELLWKHDGHSYIVIDDDTKDILPHVQDHLFIHTNMEDGFQERHLKQALDVPYFGRKYDPVRD